jgi:membrane protein implicated in regulation of membrane protease activity
MIEGILLLLIGIGALLVSIVSILRMAWLAVVIPMLIAGGAAYVLLGLARRRRRPSQATKATKRSAEEPRRMAA